MQLVNIKSLHLRIEPIISWLEWSLLVIALTCYIYFIAMSVIQVVLRQELLVSLQEAETRVSNLEASYIVVSSKLSPQTADEYGLVALDKPTYVNVSPENDHLTRNN